jgi:hypothetical protein
MPTYRISTWALMLKVNTYDDEVRKQGDEGEHLDLSGSNRMLQRAA